MGAARLPSANLLIRVRVPPILKKRKDGTRRLALTKRHQADPKNSKLLYRLNIEREKFRPIFPDHKFLTRFKISFEVTLNLSKEII